MATLIQTRLFDEGVDIVATSRGNYSDFVAKFNRKKTTDDCYTPPEVYDVVLNYVKENFLKNFSGSIVRPFKPSGDYLAEDYTNSVVVDNPPFSMYSKIVDNYERLNVPFFLFAPGLTTFVKSAKTVSYIICGANIRYANGAKVTTNFVTNLTNRPQIFITQALKRTIENAQKKPSKLQKCEIPAPYLSSAQLRKWANIGNFVVNITHDYITHNAEGRKIFGTAVKIENNDYNNLIKAL